MSEVRFCASRAATGTTVMRIRIAKFATVKCVSRFIRKFNGFAFLYRVSVSAALLTIFHNNVESRVALVLPEVYFSNLQPR